MENENIKNSNFNDKLVCIGTLADGNCLIHAILKACNNEYQNNGDVIYRTKMSIIYRKRLSEVVLEPDEDYSTEKDVVDLIKKKYETNDNKKFMEFLRMMYNYESKFIEYPVDLDEYEKDGKVYDLCDYNKYIDEYTNYLYKILNKINTKSEEKFKAPMINSPRLESMLKVSYDVSLINNFNKQIIDLINVNINRIREIVEFNLGDKLYLPTSYNSKVIEVLLEKNTDDDIIVKIPEEEIPKGKYHELPFNAKLFTINEATPLVKFDFEYNDLDEIVCLGDVPKHLNSRKFIGEGDVLMYIPYLFNINLVVMDFNNNTLITMYENRKSDKYLIVNNFENIHFETIGVKNSDNTIKTIFTDEDEIIRSFKVKNGNL